MYLPMVSENKEKEGMMDIIVCKSSDGTLKSTPFILKLTIIEKNKPILLFVNGSQQKTTMKINERNEAYFKIHEEELVENRDSSNGSTDLSLKIELSKCAHKWPANFQSEDQKDKKDEKNQSKLDELFKSSQLQDSEFKNQKDIIGKGELIYKINGKFYQEKEAWKLIMEYHLASSGLFENMPKIEGSISLGTLDQVSRNVSLRTGAEKDKNCAK